MRKWVQISVTNSPDACGEREVDVERGREGGRQRGSEVEVEVDVEREREREREMKDIRHIYIYI